MGTDDTTGESDGRTTTSRRRVLRGLGAAAVAGTGASAMVGAAAAQSVSVDVIAATGSVGGHREYLGDEAVGTDLANAIHEAALGHTTLTLDPRSLPL